MAGGVTPPRVLVERLASSRRAGLTFESAWPSALDSALAAASIGSERREWAHVLGEMVVTWRAAWDRRPASGPEHALGGLLDDERVVPIPERECERCHGEIGPERRQTAI